MRAGFGEGGLDLGGCFGQAEDGLDGAAAVEGAGAEDERGVG